MGYKFNPFTGSLDTVDSPNGVFEEIDVNGDITLDDGGTFTTTLQVVTATANRTISFPDATGTVGLVAGSSGNLVVNQSGAYAGVANSSVDNATGNITLGSRFISSLNGAASAPPGAFTGTWFTGGTATTTKPQVVIEPTGTTSTAWSTSGTGLGVNAASGFIGRLLDAQVNGTSFFNVDSTGRVSVPLGTAALPSIYPGTDTNTGIYSPGADQVAISTNGTQRATIDSLGRLLVGASSTSVNSRAVFQGRSDNATTTAEIYLQRGITNPGLNSGLGRIYFADSSSSAGAYIWAQAAENWSVNNYPTFLTIATTGASSSSPTERLRITSDGRLGLGVGAPTTLLDINSNAVRLRTARTPASAADTGAQGEISWDADYIYVCTATDTWKRAALSTW
jgi:hypothetical protein